MSNLPPRNPVNIEAEIKSKITSKPKILENKLELPPIEDGRSFLESLPQYRHLRDINEFSSMREVWIAIRRINGDTATDLDWYAWNKNSGFNMQSPEEKAVLAASNARPEPILNQAQITADQVRESFSELNPDILNWFDRYMANSPDANVLYGGKKTEPSFSFLKSEDDDIGKMKEILLDESNFQLKLDK